MARATFISVPPFFTRLSYLQNSASYALFFGCQRSIWSEPPSAHLNRFRPSSCQVYYPSLQRCPHDLDILSRTLSFRARQQVSASRDVQLHETSLRLSILLREKEKTEILFRLFEFGATDARSRRSEWPTARTRSRRVPDREVDHVIGHRIVPSGAPQETNGEVYRQGPG